MNKKGFLFTALAVIFVLVIITIASTQDLQYPRAVSEAQRIQSMEHYLVNLEGDLPRAAYIAGFRSLIATEEHVSTTGVYLTSFDDTFKEVFENGTINGTPYGIMNQSTFSDFTARFISLASQQGMVANLSLVSVTAYQTDPWDVQLDMVINATLSDTGRTASFSRLLSFRTAVPIEGIKDPVYAVGTQGRAAHTITQSNLTRPYITATNDTTLLQLLVNQTLYVASPRAPDFIDRFMGNFTPSPNGIMSLVNIKELEAQGFSPDHCKSVVDFLYFGNSPTPVNSFIVNMDQITFWLNSTHFPDYDAAGKNVGVRSCP